MTDLDAGRKLDERVARLVWPDPDTQPIWILPARFYPQTYMGPEFSTNREAAMTLLDTLAERGWDHKLERRQFASDSHRFEAVLSAGDVRPLPKCRAVSAFAPTLPLAVCRAVVAALEEA